MRERCSRGLAATGRSQHSLTLGVSCEGKEGAAAAAAVTLLDVIMREAVSIVESEIRKKKDAYTTDDHGKRRAKLDDMSEGGRDGRTDDGLHPPAFCCR